MQSDRWLLFLISCLGFFKSEISLPMAEVLVENKPMLNLFKNMGFDTQKTNEEGI
jgi:hypothetical protein